MLGQNIENEEREIQTEIEFKNIQTLDFNQLSKDELVKTGEFVANTILTKINDASDGIKRAKGLADKASNMKTGLFGGTGKKADATSAALVQTNNAVHDMNELLRLLITYTQLNGKLSKVMHSAMANMMAAGFKDSDGHITKLNDNGAEFAELVLGEAEDFSNRQFQVEQLQAQQSAALQDVQEGSEQRAAELFNKIQTLQQHSQQHVQKVRAELDEKVQSTLSRSDENDDRHQKLIDDLQEKAGDISNQSVEQDKIHSNRIAALEKELDVHRTQIEVLEESLSSNKSVKSLAVVSVVIAIASASASAFMMSVSF